MDTPTTPNFNVSCFDTASGGVIYYNAEVTAENATEARMKADELKRYELRQFLTIERRYVVTPIEND